MSAFPILPVDAWELPTSRESTWTAEGSTKEQTREVMVTGYTTAEEALNHVLNLAEGIEGRLPTYIPYDFATGNPAMLLRAIRARATDTPEVWTIVGEYKSLLRDDDGNAVDYTFSGTTSGASQNITQGLDYQSYGNGPNYQGAINVSPNGVEGVDVVVPKFEFTIDKVLPKGTLYFDYLKVLMQLTGTVNGAPFGPFARGEVLYLGADFSVKGGGDTSFNHKFVGSPNRTTANGNALSFGDITNVEKLGHEYLWVDYVAAESQGFVIRQPRSVHVHQVYPFADFTALRI
jgi:hypothetical protein